MNPTQTVTFLIRFRNAGYTILFYGLWVLQAWVKAYDTSLHHIENGQIGQGAMDALDLVARNKLFYSGGFLFLIAVLVFSGLYHLSTTKWPSLNELPEWRFSNYVSAAGVVLMLSGFFGAKIDHSLELVYLFHKLFLLKSVIYYFFPRKSSTIEYTASIILGLSAYFLLALMYSLAKMNDMPDLYMWLFVFSFIALMLNYRWPLANPQALHVLFPVVWMPLVYLLSEEYYLTMKFKGVLSPARFVAIAVLLFSVGLWIWQRLKRPTKLTSNDVLTWRWLPAVVFSLVAFGSYSYDVEYGFQERFETGNKFLPLMEHALYGTLSPLEKFNTHLLSDYFFGAIYYLINGLQGNELDCYDFLLYPFCALIYYLVLTTITKNGYIALFLAMVFPFGAHLFPIGFMVGLLPLLGFKWVVTKQATTKNYLFFAIAVVFTMLWRLEFLYATVLLVPLFMGYLAISQPAVEVNFKRITYALFAALVGLAGIVLVVAAVRDIPLSMRISQIMHYLSSVQSYGMSSIGDPDSLLYHFHYQVFPVMVLILLFFLLTPMMRKEQMTGQAWSVLTLFYLCLFYLANFQRGITRHSLQEGTDAFVSTYVYLLLLSAPFVFYRKATKLFRFMYMGGVGVLLATNFTLPKPSSPVAYFEGSLKKIAESHPSLLYQLKDRVKGRPVVDAMQPATDFFKTHLKANETFIDFSNNPLLYFASRKPTPGYFYQNPLCIHDAYLQETYIEELSKYQLPYAVFSQYHTEGFDEIDGVPNVVRHYRVAEWLYNNYEPYVIKGPFCIWKKRNLSAAIVQDTLLNIVPADTQRVVIPNRNNWCQQVYLTTRKQHSPQVTINGAEKLPQRLNDTTYLLRMNANDSTRVLVAGVKRVVVLTSEDEPDRLRESFQEVDLKQLPIVWGGEPGIEQWPVVYVDKTNLNGDNGIAYSFNQTNYVPGRGAFVLLKVHSVAKKRGQLFLFFGKKGDDNQNVIVFDTPTKTDGCWLAIRVSAFYNWHQRSMNSVHLWSDRVPGLTIDEVRLVYE